MMTVTAGQPPVRRPRYLTEQDALVAGWSVATAGLSLLAPSSHVLVESSGALRYGEVVTIGRTRVHVRVPGVGLGCGTMLTLKVLPHQVYVHPAPEELAGTTEPATVLTMSVEGIARSKGSLRPIQRGRRVVMVEQVRASKTWRSQVTRIAKEAMLEQQAVAYPTLLPVQLRAEIKFVPGASTDQVAPITSNLGDTDKLIRNLGDALQSARVVANDAQFTRHIVGKSWGETAGIVLKLVEEL